jgi:predicted N-acetyltransferase YhbS
MKNLYFIKLSPIIAVLDCCAYEDGYMIHRINVPIKHRGNGHGSELLQRALTDADNEGVRLYLGIIPSGDMGYDDLERWYGRNGFVPISDDGMYIREPVSL